MENLEYLQYYDGLSLPRLLYYDRWLIPCIEAASYCKSPGVKYIRYNQLRSICSERLRGFTKGEFNLSSGSFNSDLDKAIRKGFVKKEKVERGASKKGYESRITPKTAKFEKFLIIRKREDLDSRNTKLRKVDPDTTLQRHKRIDNELLVSVSDGLCGIVTYAKSGKVKVL